MESLGKLEVKTEIEDDSLSSVDIDIDNSVWESLKKEEVKTEINTYLPIKENLNVDNNGVENIKVKEEIDDDSLSSVDIDIDNSVWENLKKEEIQGVLWCLIAVYCVCIYKCILKYPFPKDARDSSFYSLFYASYLNGSSCEGNPIFQGLEHAADSASRTFYWMLGYGVLSALWVPVSIILMVSIIGRNRDYSGNYGIYLPWIFMTAVIVVADVCSVVVYVLDVSHTLGRQDYLEFIGATGSWDDVTEINAKGQDTAAPAVAMALLSSRVIIFWLLNFALLYHVINEWRLLGQDNLQDVDDANKYRSWERPIISQQQLDERNKQALYLDPEPRNWKGVAARRQARYTNEGASTNDNRIHAGHAQDISPKITYKLDEFGIPIEEVRSPRPGNYLDYGSEVPIIKPIRESNLLRRPSNRVASHSQPPEELRGQVPWSYLRPPPKAASPSSSAIHPVIPQPDYGMPHRRPDYHYAASRTK